MSKIEPNPTSKLSPSIYGGGDNATLEHLSKFPPSGTWLDLAAGDGRYLSELLTSCATVVAADVDQKELEKLFANTIVPPEKKLVSSVFDMRVAFPFGNETFDGVFCMGALHLFAIQVVEFVLQECSRVVRNEGRIVIDFATDVKRVKPDGNLYIIPGEPQYSGREARELLSRVFAGRKFTMQEANVPRQRVDGKDFHYCFECNFLLIDVVN